MVEFKEIAFSLLSKADAMAKATKNCTAPVERLSFGFLTVRLPKHDTSFWAETSIGGQLGERFYYTFLSEILDSTV